MKRFAHPGTGKAGCDERIERGSGMARKATDLLDVFRFGGEGPSDDGDAPKKRKRARPKSGGAAKRSPKARFEGITLNRKQVWLVSSAALLLLFLSFTLGLATGRPGSGADEALNRQTPAQFAIRARVSQIDPETSRKASPRSVLEHLATEYRIRREHMQIRSEGGEYVIEIGPFTTEDRARRYLRGSGLELARIHLGDPFRYARIEPVRWGRQAP
jgi:hypothetical protein